MIKQDILENQAKPIYLGIGSNLGNRKKNIIKAKFELNQKGIRILSSSCFYESVSWPNPRDPKFLNVVISVLTNLKPKELLYACKEIEIYLGRKKSKKNAPRICDIDILDYHNKTFVSEITLPHPRMHSRNFVLFPLFELDKDWKHPVSKHHIKKLISFLSNRDIRSIKQI